MFMQIAIAAIGVGIVLMVGYLILAQVRGSITTPQASYNNTCYGHALTDTTYCNTTAVTCGPLTDNTSLTVTCDSTSFLTGINSTQTTLFAGFGIVAVGIIVLAAFGLISIFR